jgi:hypothetical protein
VRQAGSSDAVRGAGNIVNAVRIASTIYAADEADAALYGFGDGYKARYVRIDDAKQNLSALETKPLWLEKQSFPLPCGDTSYALRIMEPSATMAGEAKFIATILADHMVRERHDAPGDLRRGQGAHGGPTTTSGTRCRRPATCATSRP